MKLQKKNDNILEKLMKKNYNNELEEVLENKTFDENTKSMLLSILYKIETAYKDYEKVKQDIESKEEFIEAIIKIIKDDCEDIKIVRLNSEESKILNNRTFLVEKAHKRIICYPIERKLLYAISKIDKKEKIIKDEYFIINTTLSELINVGKNIDTVEPMRDFNGYSWTTLAREIESIAHNLIYQNLRILVGNKFLNNWIKNNEYIIDYLELFKTRLDEKYGTKNEKEILKTLENLSILLAMKFDKKIKEKMLADKAEIEKKLEEIKDKQKFIEKITEEKRKITKEIKEIDETMNNKDMLQKEYEKRNETLPLQEKIFSKRILSKIMEDERDEKIKKIEDLNEVLSPKKFVKYKEKLEIQEEYLKLTEVTDIEKEIEENLIELQKKFLECYKIKIEKVETKNDLIKLIYIFRYYNLLPLNQEENINQIKEIEKEIEIVERELIKKGHELKIIDTFSKEEDIDYQILKSIFEVRVINLENLYIRISKEKDKYYIQLFDENAFEEKVEIKDMGKLNKKNLEKRINKKIKIFN